MQCFWGTGKYSQPKEEISALQLPYEGDRFGTRGDYTEGMFAMMHHENPDDWVLATGETHTVKEFAEKAFTT